MDLSRAFFVGCKRVSAMLLCRSGKPEPGGYTPFFAEGCPFPSRRKKGGMSMNVTYADLIQFCIFIVSLIGLCYQIFKGKK